MNDDTAEPIFTIDLGEFGGEIAPKEFDHFVDLMERERGSLSDLIEANLNDASLVHLQTNLGK